MVGRVSRIRVSSITRPSSSGTLKSTRINIRLPLSGRSRMESLDMAGCPRVQIISGSSAVIWPTVARAYSPSRMRRKRKNLQALTGDVVNQVANAAGIPPLVVVPGDHLDAIAADHQRHRRIHDRRRRVAFKVQREKFNLFENQIPLERPGF